MIMRLKVYWVGQLTSTLAFAFIKSSLVLFYRRIFRGERFYLFTTILLVIIACWAFAFLIAILLSCTPISQVWVPETERTGYCYNSNPAGIAMVSTNMYVALPFLIWLEGASGRGIARNSRFMHRDVSHLLLERSND